jgi:energy-converting hydrogenase Eha subunit E
MSSTLWAWAFVVIGMSGCVAGVAPRSGSVGFLRNFVVCAVGICLMMVLFAFFGRALHNFRLEMG